VGYWWGMDRTLHSSAYAAVPTYTGTEPEAARLVRSIAAMANTAGGHIVLRPSGPGRRDLELGALTGLVARWIAPAVPGLSLSELGDGLVAITVPDSERKPHVVVEEGPALHRGQIWVRRSSGDGEARPDDLHRIVIEAAGRLLERFGAQVRRPGFLLHEGEESQPVRLVTDPDAPLVRADPDALFPLTRQQLCDEFRKPHGWIAAAMKRLGAEDDGEMAFADRNSAGHPTRWRYAEGVRDLLAARLEAQPDWDPLHEA